MSKKKTNLQKIKNKFVTSYYQILVIFVCVIACLLLMATFGYGAYAGLIGTVISSLFLFLIAYLIAQVIGTFKVGRIKTDIRRQGSIESFDQEDLKEVANSRYFFVGKEWLLWNIKNHFQVIKRDTILGVSRIPSQNPNNDLGQLELKIKGFKHPLRLTYDIVNNKDCALALNQWVMGNYDPTKLICPHCLAPNDNKNIMCDYCGSSLE